jgi:hypothetical protein
MANSSSNYLVEQEEICKVVNDFFYAVRVSRNANLVKSMWRPVLN